MAYRVCQRTINRAKVFAILLSLLVSLLSFAEIASAQTSGTITYNTSNNKLEVYLTGFGYTEIGAGVSVGSCVVGDRGKFNYEPANHRWRYCNGTNWISFFLNTSPNTCSKEGALEFVEPYTLRYCDGTNWVSSANSANGYFVLSAGVFNGDLGGRSGANSTCLTQLIANDWLGKSNAIDRGLLVAGKVRAFLCDSSTCENANPSTQYVYARAGVPTAGGTRFTSDASGAGPNAGNSWKVTGTFNTTGNHWTGRGLDTANRWSTSPAANTCNGFTSSVAGGAYSGVTGWADSNDQNRWNNAQPNCDATNRIICFVHP